MQAVASSTANGVPWHQTAKGDASKFCARCLHEKQGGRLESQARHGGMMNSNPFKHAYYVHLLATAHVFQQMAQCRIPAKNPWPRRAYSGSFDPRWQSPGGHFGRCSHGMDGASLCTTSGSTGVLYFKTACNVSFDSDLLNFEHQHRRQVNDLQVCCFMGH